MAYLINRTPPARLRCLHALLQFALAKFGEEQFHMGDLLYDPEKNNIHNYCRLLKEDKNLNIKYCPFLQNPLSNAGCYLTRGVNDDSTKKKEISNSVNSLDALGLIDRVDRDLKITGLGRRFVSVDFESTEWLKIARDAVCNYGLAVGLLYQIEKCGNNFTTGELTVGYPNTDEYILIDGETIEISSGSKGDSNTRTKSCLIAWFTTVGFIVPNSIQKLVNLNQSHIDTNEYMINQSIRNESKYSKGLMPKIFSGKFIVNKPFTYKNLTKDSTALRENGQAVSRQKTMEYNEIICNRRFAILYALNFCFINNYLLNFSKFIDQLSKYPDYFMIADNNFKSVMMTELEIAGMCGIPFEVSANECLRPVTGLNIEILIRNAPQDIIQLLNDKILTNSYEVSI
jgi:hypothetical protein